MCVHRGRHASVFINKGPRSNWRDEQHAAPMPENVESALSKSTRSFLHHVRWRQRFAGAGVFNHTIERRIWQMPAQNSADGQLCSAENQIRQIIRPKMPFCFGSGRKHRRIFFADGCVCRHGPRFVFPALDQRWIIHDLDLPLIIGKAHSAAKTLLVKAAELRLIMVVVRWSKKRSAQSTSRYIREISLDGIRLRDVDLVEIFVGKSKTVPLEQFSIQR